jgi:hypothetical protein
MILALFAAIPSGLTAFAAVFVLLFAILVPMLLVSIGYADSVFSADKEQDCLALGNSIGGMLATLIAVIPAGAVSLLKEIALVVAGTLLAETSDYVKECFD